MRQGGCSTVLPVSRLNSMTASASARQKRRGFAPAGGRCVWAEVVLIVGRCVVVQRLPEQLRSLAADGSGSFFGQLSGASVSVKEKAGKCAV